MKVKLLCLFICFSFLSCDITKSATKSKTDSSIVEEVETKTVRKGDTVRFLVPKIIYKDTTITTYNHQGSRLDIVYDQTGQISNADCYTSAFEFYEKKRAESELSEKNKSKDKEEKVNTTWILYGFIAISVIVCFAILMFYFYMRKNTVLINQLINKQ